MSDRSLIDSALGSQHCVTAWYYLGKTAVLLLYHDWATPRRRNAGRSGCSRFLPLLMIDVRLSGTCNPLIHLIILILELLRVAVGLLRLHVLLRAWPESKAAVLVCPWRDAVE